jgi:hypothetical protein
MRYEQTLNPGPEGPTVSAMGQGQVSSGSCAGRCQNHHEAIFFCGVLWEICQESIHLGYSGAGLPSRFLNTLQEGSSDRAEGSELSAGCLGQPPRPPTAKDMMLTFFTSPCLSRAPEHKHLVG